MPMFRTRYKLPNGQSRTTQCYAESAEHLEEVMKLRGMDETRDDPYNGYSFFTDSMPEPKMASELMVQRKFAAANHALIWTGMIAVRAGIADAWALLNDEGLVHEVAHLLHSQELGSISGLFRAAEPEHVRIARRIEAFERLVPGVHPCWAGEDRTVVEAYRSPTIDVYQRLMGLSKSFEMMRPQPEKLRDTFERLSKTVTASGQLTRGELSNHMDRILIDDLNDPVYTAPRAKVGSKKFEQQRLAQINAQAQRKAKLIEQLRGKRGAMRAGDPDMTPRDQQVEKLRLLSERGSRRPYKSATGRNSDVLILDDIDEMSAPRDEASKRKLMASVYGAGENVVSVGGKKVGNVTGVTIDIETMDPKKPGSLLAAYVSDQAARRFLALDLGRVERRAMAQLTNMMVGDVA